MSTHPVLSVVIRCDGCHHDLREPQTDHPMLWPIRDDAISCLSAEWAGEPSWAFSASLAGPDLCPACLGTRDGHRYRQDPPGRSMPQRWCGRCGAVSEDDRAGLTTMPTGGASPIAGSAS